MNLPSQLEPIERLPAVLHAEPTNGVFAEIFASRWSHKVETGATILQALMGMAFANRIGDDTQGLAMCITKVSL
jgi:hypothetical protein